MSGNRAELCCCFVSLHAIIMLWQAGTENDSNSGNESEIAGWERQRLSCLKLRLQKPKKSE